MRAWTSPDLPRLDYAPTGPVRVHDTATGELVALDPRGSARLYVCGITPYDATHIGHAATYVAFDLLNRAWRDAGHDVHYVQNVTDVDDPLLERATATGVDWTDLAERETELFREDMAALRVLAAGPLRRRGRGDPGPRIGADQPAAGAGCGLRRRRRPLLRRRTPTPASGPCPGSTRRGMLRIFAERGGDPDRAGKKHPLDCLLWRAERPGEPAWDTGRSAAGAPAGTSSARRSRCTTSVTPSTSRAVAATWSSRTTRCARRTPRSPTGGRPSLGPTCTPAWSGSRARRCRSPRATWSSSRACAPSGRRPDGDPAGAARAPLPLRLGVDRRACSRRPWRDLAAAAARRGAPTGARATDAIALVRTSLARRPDAPAALAALLDAWARATEQGDTTDPSAGAVMAAVADACLGLGLT